MSEVHNVPTPELDRQRDIIHSGKAQTVQNFIDWLRDEKKYVLAEWSEASKQPMSGEDQELFPVFIQPEDLMAEFFGIDRNKIEQERRALLAAIQKDNS
jgi:hypothetical protein